MGKRVPDGELIDMKPPKTGGSRVSRVGEAAQKYGPDRGKQAKQGRYSSAHCQLAVMLYL